MIWLYIAAGGAVGAMARYGVAGWVQERGGFHFPWGTLAVNILGSVLIGASLRYLEATPATAEVRALVTVGLLGAFTTFSTFSYETVALLHLLREKGFAGATVLRGIAGFGASARVHTDRILRLSMDLPIVVEVVDGEDRIQAVMPELDRMIGGGLITLERVHVILYRPANAAEDDRARRRTEGLEPGS